VAAGVATYVRDRWSPIGAKCDCLGGGESDLDREGRCAAPQLALGRPGLPASMQSSRDTRCDLTSLGGSAEVNRWVLPYEYSNVVGAWPAPSALLAPSPQPQAPWRPQAGGKGRQGKARARQVFALPRVVETDHGLPQGSGDRPRRVCAHQHVRAQRRRRARGAPARRLQAALPAGAARPRTQPPQSLIKSHSLVFRRANPGPAAAAAPHAPIVTLAGVLPTSTHAPGARR